MQFLSRLLRSVLAGVYISAGCVAYILATYGELHTKGLGAVLFSFGIGVACYCDLDVFTNRVSLLVTRPPDKLFSTMFYLFNVWFGNFLGCFISAWAMNKTRYSHVLHSAAQGIAARHIADNPPGLFIAGLGCTLMLYMAARIYNDNKDTIYGMAGLLLATTSFIVAGFEHTVAASFFMILANVTFIERFSSLFPIALGNTIGAIIPAAVINYARADSLIDKDD